MTAVVCLDRSSVRAQLKCLSAGWSLELEYPHGSVRLACAHDDCAQALPSVSKALMACMLFVVWSIPSPAQAQGAVTRRGYQSKGVAGEGAQPELGVERRLRRQNKKPGGDTGEAHNGTF